MDLATLHPHLKDFFALLPILNQESERGRVLVAVSFVDEQIRSILKAFFVDDKRVSIIFDGYNAALGSFAARLTAALGLALISEREFQECQILRKIRNEFAHDHRVSFSDQRISSLCKALSYKANDYVSADEKSVILSAHEQFTTAATSLMMQLANRPTYVAAIRLSPREWPY